MLCAILTFLLITIVSCFPSYAAKASSGESVLVFDDGSGVVKEDLSGVDTEDESNLVKETEAYLGSHDTGAALTKGQLVVNFATQFIGNPYRF
jgi:ABC-type Na+ efflux pump permease subunit